jgi:hypothetical protein
MSLAMDARITIHSLAEARTALVAAGGGAVTLASAPNAGAYAGASWFKSLIKQVKSEFPESRCEALLDCGEDAGAALAALRLGVKRVSFAGHPAARARLASVADALGSTLESR